MTATYSQAYDEMAKVFTDAWEGTGYPVVWPDVKPEREKPGPDAWARFNVQNVFSGQSSLSGPDGKQRFTRTGLVSVQIFTPYGEGLSKAHDLASMVSSAYEGASTPSGVWFRNVRVNEIGPDGEFFQTNVVSEFEFDEVK